MHIRRNLIDNYSEELSYRQLNIILEVFEDLGCKLPEEDRKAHYMDDEVDACLIRAALRGEI